MNILDRFEEHRDGPRKMGTFFKSPVLEADFTSQIGSSTWPDEVKQRRYTVKLGQIFYCKDSEYHLAKERAKQEVIHLIYGDVYDMARELFEALYAHDREKSLEVAERIAKATRP